MNCPRCNVGLNEVKVDEVVVSRCGQCSGVWFDFGELERVLSRESYSLRVLLPRGRPQLQAKVDTLACPRCASILMRMRASPEPVTYYGCLGCYGRWLDGAELERIVGRPLAIKFEKLIRRLFD